MGEQFEPVEASVTVDSSHGSPEDAALALIQWIREEPDTEVYVHVTDTRGRIVTVAVLGTTATITGRSW